MQKLRRKLTYANVAATLALIVAVAGGSTAVAVTVNASKKSDVNKKDNIRAGRVTAAKLAGVDIVQQGGDNGQATAFCPAGERLLSGGATGADVRVSAPTPQGDGWTVVAVSGGVNASAVCLKANPGP